jgi:hypothetical protein
MAATASLTRQRRGSVITKSRASCVVMTRTDIDGFMKPDSPIPATA